MTRIRNVIRTTREEQGLRLAELATRTGLSVAALGRLERTSCDPSLTVALALADALETSIECLFEEVPDVHPPRDPRRPARRTDARVPDRRRALRLHRRGPVQ